MAIEPSLRARRNKWVQKEEGDFGLITIFKVPPSTRSGSAGDFEPQELHVGLFRKNRWDGNRIDEVKQRLALLLDQRLVLQNSDWDEFVREVVPNVEDVRYCYEMDIRPPSSAGTSAPSGSSSNDLQESDEESLTLDALFLVLCLHAANGRYILKDSEEIFQNLPPIDLDLIQLENQVPMQLLKAVIGVLKSKQVEEDLIIHTDAEEDLDSILKQAVRICYPFLQKPSSPPQGSSGAAPGPDTLSEYLEKNYGGKVLTKCHHILECVYRVVCGHTGSGNPDAPWNDNSVSANANEVRITLDSIDRTQPAVSMEQGSIKLRAEATSILEIQFDNENANGHGGCWCGSSCCKSVSLNLPQVKMDNNATARFRNLAIYEQRACRGGDLRNYLQLMSELVNTAADAELLRKRGVIKNWLGSDYEIFQAWTRMCDCLESAYPTLKWVKRLKRIDKHCNNWGHRARRECYTTYCSTPGLTLSIVVLVLIFLFTVLQTYTAIIGTDHMKPVFKSG